MAEGYGGQLIVVVPRSRSVVVATARWQGVGEAAASSQLHELLDVLDRLVLPEL